MSDLLLALYLSLIHISEHEVRRKVDQGGRAVGALSLDFTCHSYHFFVLFERELLGYESREIEKTFQHPSVLHLYFVENLVYVLPKLLVEVFERVRRLILLVGRN